MYVFKSTCACATGNISKRMCNSISIKKPWCINKHEETISTNAGNYSKALQYGHGSSRALCAKGIRSRRYAVCKEAMNLPQRTDWHFTMFIHLEKKKSSVEWFHLPLISHPVASWHWAQHVIAKVLQVTWILARLKPLWPTPWATCRLCYQGRLWARSTEPYWVEPLLLWQTVTYSTVCSPSSEVLWLWVSVCVVC